jgi:hypothetical protein
MKENAAGQTLEQFLIFRTFASGSSLWPLSTDCGNLEIAFVHQHGIPNTYSTLP